MILGRGLWEYIMIILEKLIYDNWFSYGKSNVIYLNRDNITQLTGLVGAGKSSIPLILQEVLYGKNVKGIKKSEIRNRKGNKGAVRYFNDLCLLGVAKYPTAITWMICC